MDQQKDQREELRKKVKLLEQEIVQRARNYMQSNRIKQKKSSNSNSNKCQSKGIQTETKNGILQESNKQNVLNGKQVIIEELYNARKQIDEFGSKNLKNYEKSEIASQNLGFKIQANCLEMLIKNINDLFSQCVGMAALSINNQLQHSFNCQDPAIYVKNLKNKYLLNMDSLLKQIASRPAFMSKQVQKLKGKIDRRQKKLKQSQTRCELITKALNQSQQTNYQLRLKLQQAQIKLRNTLQKMQENRTKMELNESESQKMKVKIEQMEVMKKQYLRAYSKIKEEKQGLEMQIIDLREELQNKTRSREYFGEPIYENWGDNSRISEDQIKLKTIVEHIEDERIDDKWRATQTQNTLLGIKEIIQHALMQTNRSTSQKWIKSALVKLQQYEHYQLQESQKQITSQTVIQATIHQKYKNILSNISKSVNKNREQAQISFNRIIEKIIGFQNIKQVCQNKVPEQTKIVKIQNNDHREEKSDIQQPSQNANLDPKVYELVSKLNQSHLKYAELKKKYDTLLQKQEILGSKNSLNLIYTKAQSDLKSFMSKVLKMQSQNKIKHKNSKFTEQLFDKLAHRVFQILCNLPSNSHSLMFFVPTNQEQLEDALELIYKFTLEYDQIQEAKFKEFRNQAFSLTKVLEEIAVAKQVPAQMVIQSINNNFAEENTMSGEYVKSLIKKLSSHQNSPPKNKSAKTIQTQNQVKKTEVKSEN